MPGTAQTTPKGRPTPKRPAKAATAPPAPPLEPTSPGEWRSVRRQGHPVTLPSGNVARLRKTFNMINLVESGSIPNPLGEYIADAVQAARAGNPTAGTLDLAKLDQSTPEGRVAFAQFLALMMESMPDIFVSPKVVLVPDGEDASTWEPEEPGAISVVDLDLPDQMAAFAFAQGGAEAMAPFRAGPKQAVESAQDGGGVQLPPE